MTAKYVIGIDLGTTNSVLAYAPITDDGGDAQVQLLPIPQLVSAGTVDSPSALPSFLYLPAEHERGDESLKSPLDLAEGDGNGQVTGEFARTRGAEVPERTVAAAKSWLCHSRVDRHQPILPWGAPVEVEKVSPITASRYFLAHLIAAWNAAMPEAPFTQQQVVLTVPASFDASARELTREAALAAGLPEDFVLLEEPQAAVYSWLATTGDDWRKRLSVDDVVLVCDVGGGTTDLTLVTVAEEEGQLVLRRLAVGDHLLVGGDNMDLTLAHFVAAKFAEQGTKLDPWQSVALWHACRDAKESLLRPDGAETHPVAVLGRGRKLIGGTVKIDVQREAAAALLTEGFFPVCSIDEHPKRQPASGFQEIGLPFEADTGITRHLAAFLTSQGGDDGPIRPTHVLFGGGVFKASAFQDRLLSIVGSWFGEDVKPESLDATADLDHATARGAAFYGLAKETGGIRIRGGTARSYYVGVETSGPAIPGMPRPLRAMCVVPIGMEEGTETEVPGSEVGLVVGEPAQFRFFSSSLRRDDRPGDLLASWDEDEVIETDSMEALLPSEDTNETYVPVRFHSKITELGMFELWCVSPRDARRWKLEFSVREDAE